jgi:hypothetical protein
MPELEVEHRIQIWIMDVLHKYKYMYGMGKTRMTGNNSRGQLHNFLKITVKVKQ